MNLAHVLGEPAENARRRDEATVRPFFWSVKRELWENRFVVIAPIVVAVVVVLGTSIAALRLPHRLQNLDPAKQHAAVVTPVSMAPAPIMLATFLIGFFYCIDALHAERRDRSILFWKSLPVSDRTTVLSKAAIPLPVLPAIALILSIVAQTIVLFVGTIALAGTPGGVAMLWRELHLVEEPVVMVYGLTAHVLWFSPIHGWLLLVSAWARRTPLLWAVLPPVLLVILERLVAGTSHVGAFIGNRFIGAMQVAFVSRPGKMPKSVEHLSDLSPLRFVTTPALWLGLAFASLCLFAAMRLRRERDPG